MSEPATRRLHRYELSVKLGEGGMGAVYLALAEGLAGFERLVAVKCCHRHLLQDGDFVAMFLDEARIAARIHHPNVVGTLDVNQSHGQLYMVMDYIEGVLLGDLITLCREREDTIPVGAALRITRDALKGLHAAHELTEPDGTPLNLVHRDVSPKNIIVGTDGIARIMDFGVAKAEARLASTGLGRLKGTLGYMAPEQIRGEQVTRKTDVFAMGAVLWEALVGRRLFRGKTPDVIAMKITRAIVQPPTWFREDVHQDVSTIALRALAQEPDDRTPTALAMAEAIEASGHMGQEKEVSAFVERVAAEQVRARREAKAAIFQRRNVPKELPEIEEPTESLSLPATALSEETTVRIRPETLDDAMNAATDVATGKLPQRELATVVARMKKEAAPSFEVDDAPTELMAEPPVEEPEIEVVAPEVDSGDSTLSIADTVPMPPRASVPVPPPELFEPPTEEHATRRRVALAHDKDAAALRRRPTWALVFLVLIAAVAIGLGYFFAEAAGG